MAEDLTATSDNPGGELDWIPENFRRDTVEESARVLLESQKEAQRKITEEATARRNLEQLLVQANAEKEHWQTQATQQPEQDQSDWYTAYEQDPIATMRALVAQENQGRVDPLAQTTAEQMQILANGQAQLIADSAYSRLERERGPLDEETAKAMREVFAEHPHLMTPEVAADQEKLTKTLLLARDIAEMKISPRTTQSQADLQRAMKLQAQTATGAGGHLSTADENEQRWQEISNASTGKLGL